MRRNKNDMRLMKNEVTYYLLQTKNNPHAAHELMIKEYLESHTSIPYYVKGVKDFINVSQELAIQLNQKEQMTKQNQQRQEQKQNIINFILNLTVEDIKSIYKAYKDKVAHSEKLNLVNVYTAIYNNEFSEKDIDQSIINTFQTIYQDRTA